MVTFSVSDERHLEKKHRHRTEGQNYIPLRGEERGNFWPFISHLSSPFAQCNASSTLSLLYAGVKRWRTH